MEQLLDDKKKSHLEEEHSEERGIESQKSFDY